MIEKIFQNELDRTREMVQKPDWYLEFGKARKTRLLGLGALQAAFSGSITQAATYAKTQMVEIFEQLLASHDIRLGIPGEDELDNQDEDREPISQVVIHHSSRGNGISLASLNALHLLNLYVPVYQNTRNPVLNSTGKHQPIYSGHFDDSGEQVFYGYHWKVSQDGSATRLLNDEAIGWHAGNWEINKRSVGICIDDDLEHKSPTDTSIESVAQILKDHYRQLEITGSTVIGHNEASKTACPGDEFLGNWKKRLLEIARR